MEIDFLTQVPEKDKVSTLLLSLFHPCHVTSFLCHVTNYFVTGIVKYMLEQNQPASSMVTSLKEVYQLLRSTNSPLVVSCSDTQDKFFHLANEGRRSPLTFVHTDSHELCSSIGLEYGTYGILKPDM